MSLVPFLYYMLVKRASARKINRVSRNAQSQRALTMNCDAAKRRREVAGWKAHGPRGEGFARDFFFGPGGAIEVKRARLVFGTRGQAALYNRPIYLFLSSSLVLAGPTSEIRTVGE
jgi:hypothetical protein